MTWCNAEDVLINIFASCIFFIVFVLNWLGLNSCHWDQLKNVCLILTIVIIKIFLLRLQCIMSWTRRAMSNVFSLSTLIAYHLCNVRIVFRDPCLPRKQKYFFKTTLLNIQSVKWQLNSESSLFKIKSWIYYNIWFQASRVWF